MSQFEHGYLYKCQKIAIAWLMTECPGFLSIKSVGYGTMIALATGHFYNYIFSNTFKTLYFGVYSKQQGNNSIVSTDNKQKTD